MAKCSRRRQRGEIFQIDAVVPQHDLIARHPVIEQLLLFLLRGCNHPRRVAEQRPAENPVPHAFQPETPIDGPGHPKRLERVWHACANAIVSYGGPDQVVKPINMHEIEIAHVFSTKRQQSGIECRRPIIGDRSQVNHLDSAEFRPARNVRLAVPRCEYCDPVPAPCQTLGDGANLDGWTAFFEERVVRWRHMEELHQIVPAIAGIRPKQHLVSKIALFA